MKPFSNRISKLVALSSATVLLLAAWSPPTGDHLVLIGAGNDLDGFLGNIPSGPPNVDISPFRGQVLGNWNYLGTPSTSHHGVVAGGSNFGNTYWSFVGGMQNKLALTGKTTSTSASMVGVFGDYNVVANSNSRLLVTGYSNSINGNASLVSGTNNSISASSGACSNSVAAGNSNIVAASQGWAVGESNTVRSDGGVAIGYNSKAGKDSVGSNEIQRAVALGTGVAAEKTDSTALGRYNAAMQANDVLAIGSGSDNNNRFTAFRVTNDGGIILGRAQGDISMGQYGN